MLNIFRIVAIIAFISVVLGKQTSLEWTKCGRVLCTTILVPLNHHDSNSSLIPIALKKYPARIQPPKMTILVNPGGPGASAANIVLNKGYRFVKIFGDQVDIVGFDPRGVGQSFKLNCVSSEQAAGISESFRYFQIPFLPKGARQAQINYFETGWKANADICSAKAGDSLAYFSTANTARDMEIIRKALNMERMNFLGLSYGGTLAVTYANLFPDKVGRMILSSTPNPDHYFSDTVSFLKSSLRFTEKTFAKIMDQCDQTSNCPLYERGRKSIDKIRIILESLSKSPYIDTKSNHPGILTRQKLELALVNSLYDVSTWPQLATALAAFLSGSSNSLFELTKLTNIVPSADCNVSTNFFAIFCADQEKSSDASTREWVNEIVNSESFHSFFGRTMLSKAWGCLHWKKFESQERYIGPWNNTFAHPLLIFGNSFDPISPLEASAEIHELLKRNDRINSVFIKSNSIGHGPFSQNSQCVFDIFRSYMLYGILPPENTVCQPDTLNIFETNRLGLLVQAIDIIQS